MANYSREVTAVFKKADRLAISLRANVSIIMISNRGNVREYVSPNTTHKMMYDLYQEMKGVNIWEPYVEKLNDELQMLNDENASLRNELKLWNGDRESLHALSYVERENLIKEMNGAIDLIQVRENHVLEGKIVKTKRKLKNAKNIYKCLMFEYNARLGNGADEVVNERQEIAPEDVASDPNMPGYAMW